MARALVFPGQGSQAVGMGKDLADAFAAAREVFEEVNEALDQNLSRLMFEGPEDQLTLTENAQPALMASTWRRSPPWSPATRSANTRPCAPPARWRSAIPPAC